MIEPGKTYRIKGESKYFTRKYGAANPEIVIEATEDYHKSFSPPTFLYIGRMLAEDLPTDGNTYYGHINGLGEFVHETELEEISIGEEWKIGTTMPKLREICSHRQGDNDCD